MALRGISTRHNSKKHAISITVDGITIALSHAEARGKSAQGLLTALAARARKAGVTLPVVAIHRNKNGRLAIATGTPPGQVVWPEDQRRNERLARQGHL